MKQNNNGLRAAKNDLGDNRVNYNTLFPFDKSQTTCQYAWKTQFIAI